MANIVIQNQTRPYTRQLLARRCDTFGSKLRGLMGYAPLAESEAILLVENSPSRVNSAIHMLFMRMDISVIWLDQQKTVVDTCLARAWRLAYVPSRPACFTIEAHPSRLNEFQVGDQLVFSND